MIFTCIHNRTANSQDTVECLDCEELAALRHCEERLRELTISIPALDRLDAIRRRKGTGAIGHPETRDLEPKR